MVFLETIFNVSNEGKDKPLSVRTRFRTNRETENLAKYISLWKLTINTEYVTQYQPEELLSWKPFDPVELSLTWAKGSLVRPVRGYSDLRFLRVEGDQAFIEEDGAWSLFKMMEEYGEDGLCSGVASCLSIYVPVDFVAVNNSRLRGGEFEGFVELTVEDEDGPFQLPEFPNTIPTLKMISE